MAALSHPDVQETVIREIVTSIPLPEGIKLQRLEFRNDSTDDPALFLTYSIDESLKSDDEWVQDLSALTQATRRRLRDMDVSLFPYLHFVAAQ